jgi:hypothetical protein
MITGHDNLSKNEPRGQRRLRNLKLKPFSFQLPNGVVWSGIKGVNEGI